MSNIHTIKMCFKQFSVTLKKLTAHERRTNPTWHFGERFNSLLEQAIAACPDVPAELWPKPVNKATDKTCEQHYCEIETYAGEITVILETQEKPKISIHKN